MKMEKINVIILDDSLDERFEIENILTNINYISMSVSPESIVEAREILASKPADVAILSRNFNGDGYAAAEVISTISPGTAMIILEKELSEDVMTKVIQSGIRDVVKKPINPSKLVDSIYKAHQLMKSRMPAPNAQGESPLDGSVYGQIFSVFSTKGGAGKTFLAVNLATMLAEKTGKKVALLDFDFDYGSVALALDLEPANTVNELAKAIRTLQPEDLIGYITPHRSGVDVLATATIPQPSDGVGPEEVQLILKAIQRAYDYIVIDMPSRFYSAINAGFIHADKLFLVVNPEVEAVRNLKSALGTLAEISYPKAKLSLVVNKYSPKSELKEKDIESALGMEAAYLVGSDDQVSSSLNQGTPYISLNPKSTLRKAIERMAGDIINR